jgi:glycerophosphoryl diester phosphodiesterase
VDATLPLGLICETQPELSLWPELPLNYVIPHYRLLRRDLVRQIKSAGQKILVWTVNVPDEMSRLAEWGVDGIISDNPKRLVRTLKRD